MDRQQRSTNNIFKQFEYKAQLHYVWIQDIIVKYSFFDTEVYIKRNKLYTKIYRKETNRQNFLHINLEHHIISSKNSISYSQVLRGKCIFSTIKNFKNFIAQNLTHYSAVLLFYISWKKRTFNININ